MTIICCNNYESWMDVFLYHFKNLNLKLSIWIFKIFNVKKMNRIFNINRNTFKSTTRLLSVKKSSLFQSRFNSTIAGEKNQLVKGQTPYTPPVSITTPPIERLEGLSAILAKAIEVRIG